MVCDFISLGRYLLQVGKGKGGLVQLSTLDMSQLLLLLLTVLILLFSTQQVLVMLLPQFCRWWLSCLQLWVAVGIVAGEGACAAGVGSS